MLNERSFFTEIGKALGKDRTTVSKEVRSHLIFRYKGKNCNAFAIAFPVTSTISALYVGLIGGLGCATDVLPAISSVRILLRLFTRNSSRSRISVSDAVYLGYTLEKFFYFAPDAHVEYSETLSEARSGFSLTEDEFDYVDEIVSSHKAGTGSAPYLRKQHGFPDLQ